MKTRIAFLTLVVILISTCIFAQQYALKRSVFGSGGGITSNNNYQIIGTLGQPVIGEMSGTNHVNQVGFWFVVNFQACIPGLFGDVSGDTAVNSTDALIILSFDAGLIIPPQVLDRITVGFGNVNEDASTNSTDALIILSYDAGIPILFPVGDPVCLPNGGNRIGGSIPRQETVF